MSTDLSPNGSTEFLNFSDALHHLRWGEKIARRAWTQGQYLRATYDGPVPAIAQRKVWIDGEDIMAEDWYVV